MFPVLAGSNPSGYNLTRSLRFRASASAYLNRTPASAGNQQKFTWSGWVKRGKLSSEQAIIVCRTGSSTEFGRLTFNTSDQLDLWIRNSSSITLVRLVTTQVFRDPSAWYHVVMTVDTTQATAANRAIFYINGTQVTAYGTATYPSQNANLDFNTANLTTIGVEVPNATYYDGYLTEVNFIDGQALTPSSFGSTNALTGVWQPARYTGTYGTNGFYLPFTDNSALTTSSNVGLGKDFSGNGNYWTTNNISITSGVTYDSMTDVPTLTSATAANFAVLNPLQLFNPVGTTAPAVFADGNLNFRSSTTAQTFASATIGFSSGKYYCEFVANPLGADGVVGVWKSPITQANYYYVLPDSITYYSGGAIQLAGTPTGTTYSSWTANDVMGIALDMTSGKVYFSKNGTWQGSSDPATGANPAYSGLTGTYIFGAGTGGGGGIVTANFGQRPFSYTPPTGFVALNTYNLPTSTILKGNKVMDATLYTGNSSTQTVTNAGAFKPDLVWIKDRSSVAQHVLTDSVRGVDRQLFSSLTNAEQTSATGITSLNSNGFSLGVNVSPTGNTNGSPDNFVAWQWQAGQGSTSSNTSGTITSTVSVNASAGFSVVTWTGTGANATVGHGLGVAPQLIINKPRNSADNWISWHTSLGATGYIYLNLTNASATAATVWNSTLPTSSVFSVGTSSNINTSGQTMVSYCWTPIAGYSAFGSYTGNGADNGTFVYTGFRPKFVMWKNITDYGSPYPYASWGIIDSSAMPYNAAAQGTQLWANNSAAQGYRGNGSSADTQPGNIDLLSNGFKFRTSYIEDNAASTNYIYIAFAENPFKNSLAR